MLVLVLLLVLLRERALTSPASGGQCSFCPLTSPPLAAGGLAARARARALRWRRRRAATAARSERVHAREGCAC